MNLSPGSIHFPPQRHYRVTRRLPLLAVCLLGAALVWPSSALLGAAFLAGAVAVSVPMLTSEWTNARARRAWARAFSRHVHAGGVGELARAHPGGYRLHFREYHGFEMNRLPAAALLENLETGELLPVWPPPKIIETFHAVDGLEVVRH
ncbi:MAG TPA: hypothetical protein DIT64_03585 [Verrucomicrobiales bacterium]|nr:hypothetical protein [Verrucomicrobiales bacterium]